MKITKARADAILRAIEWFEIMSEGQEEERVLTWRFVDYLEQQGFRSLFPEIFVILLSDTLEEGQYGLRYLEGRWELVSHRLVIQVFQTATELFTFIRKATQ